MPTWVWLSAAVLNVCDFFVGMVVFFGIMRVNTPPKGLDAKRQRRHVQQQQAADVATEHAALDGSADGHGLVGVHATERLAPEELAHDLDDLWDACHAADQHGLSDVLRFYASVLQARLHGRERPLDEVVHQRLELAARQGHLDVLRPVSRGSNEGKG